MSKINISNLSFGFGDNTIFENISLSLDSSWKLGLVGRNGRGKTTLLRLLCGKYEYSGTISSPLTFEYFPYDISDTDVMVLDALTALYPELEQWRLKKELYLLGMDEGTLYMPYSSLSLGQQTKLQLALMFSKENSFLLIDEPTNHLDSDGRHSVSEYLNSKQGFILVSHDRNFLDSCTDHILSINKSTVELHKGSYSSWQREFERIQEKEQSENKRLKGEIERLAESARKKQQWSDEVEKTKKSTRNSGLRPDRGYTGHKAAKMAKRSKSVVSRMEQDIESRKKLLKNYESAPPVSISPKNCPFKRLITVNDLFLSYDGKQVFKGLNLSLDFGERIALVGKNGCGKSTLLKLINGSLAPCSGKIIMPESLSLSYLPQDLNSLTGKLDDFIISNGCDHTLYKTILRKLGFDRSTFDVPLDSMSLGQQKKVAIAASLCTQAHLYLWDEPLNYLDLMSRIQLEQLLIECKPTMILVEHDQAFITNTATRIVTL